MTCAAIVRTLSICSLLFAACVTPASDDEGGSSETGPDTPHATLLVSVLPSACDDAKVVQVQVRARRVACAEPGPCTIPANPPAIEGDIATCPISDERVIAVVVDESGRYLVDTVSDRTPDDPVYECHAVSAMELDVLVTNVDLQIPAQYELIALGMPCPDPD
jgi:hypothetical protein